MNRSRFFVIILLLMCRSEAEVLNYENCGTTPQAIELAKLIMNDPDQQRPTLKCDPLLSKIAAQKAKEMAESGKVEHYFNDTSPNQRLLNAGYPLFVQENIESENQVEAIIGGFDNAEDVWLHFKNSYWHRLHLLAEQPFYEMQNDIGVGHFYKWHSPHIDYWVVYIAQRKPVVEVKNVEVEKKQL